MGPIAEAVVNNVGMGAEANNLLYTAIWYRSPTEGPDAIHAEIQTIGVELMQAHLNAVNVLGSPTAAQIAQYHSRVFARHNLPGSTFGGAALTGSEFEASLTAPVWLDGC